MMAPFDPKKLRPRGGESPLPPKQHGKNMTCWCCKKELDYTGNYHRRHTWNYYTWNIDALRSVRVCLECNGTRYYDPLTKSIKEKN
jgi:hypothetical protein